jgi:hypothetical protein
VNGAFCFWMPFDKTRDLLDPRIEDNGLPLLRTWTINGYPLFYHRLMTRRLNSPGTLSAKPASELAVALAARLPAASQVAVSPAKKSVGPTESAEVPPPTATRRMSKDEYKALKAAEHQQQWEQQLGMVEAALGCPVPTLLSERLGTDGAIWCHHALWHCRVYLACVHGKVGHHFSYQQAASVVAAHHNGSPGRWQWRALTAFLEHLRTAGYVKFTEAPDGRIADALTTADLQHPPRA